MQKLLLLGDEAIAQGAMDAGISGIYAYPGTPSTEITEYVQNLKRASKQNIHSNWSANEKTAMEAALGMSYAGKRAMVCMKHVGLNVAADPFMNSAITGVNGGMIVVAADDPSILLRITTRLAHSRSGVQKKEPRAMNELSLPVDLRQFVLLPAIARKRYRNLLNDQPSFEMESEKSRIEFRKTNWPL